MDDFTTMIATRLTPDRLDRLLAELRDSPGDGQRRARKAVARARQSLAPDDLVAARDALAAIEHNRRRHLLAAVN